MRARVVFALNREPDKAKRVARASRAGTSAYAARAHKRGRFAPSCESPPLGDVCVCPRPQTNLSTYCGKI